MTDQEDLDIVSAPRSTHPASAGQRLRDLYTSEWHWRTAELGDQSMGSSGPIDPFLPDVSEAAQQRRRQRWEDTLAELDEIDTDALSASERLDARVYRNQLCTLIQRQHQRSYLRPANADSAFWSDLPMRMARRQLSTAADAEAYLGQLGGIASQFAQHIDNMRTGLAGGIGPPRVTMTGREQPVRSIATATDVTELPFFEPIANLPGSIDRSARDRLVAAAESVLAGAVVPAYAELLTFLTEEYLPGLPESIAVYDQPGGEEFYAAALREYTTTGFGPQQIFDIGVEQVAAIRAEMEQVATQVGFADDVPGLLRFMRTDPQFYATTPRQLLSEAAYTCKAFDGVVHSYFGTLPHQRFTITEPPPDIAPYYTFGRGAPDRYILNTYNLPARPLYSLPALTLHESAPGHSFQTALALELDQPEFRRQIYISAYGEGWGLYCERLGVEMGMYTTPYEVMGMLSFQMWRAVRLVVDPGIHALEWSRERAQDYLREHTAIADHEIVTEIDRYIAWPGQATSYYLGMLTMQQLRARAEAALGSAFSLRDFHDAVLGTGSVPLDVLEDHIDEVIAAAQATPEES